MKGVNKGWCRGERGKYIKSESERKCETTNSMSHGIHMTVLVIFCVSSACKINNVNQVFKVYYFLLSMFVNL